jgi:hypothetical protein
MPPSAAAMKWKEEFYRTQRKESLFLIGRRTVTAYNLSSAYLLRVQQLRFMLEGHGAGGKGKGGKGSQSSSSSSSGGGSNASGGFFAQRATKEKFSGGKLLFETYYDKVSQIASQLPMTNTRGRLPNILCDFIVPLLQEDLIELKGHVLFDIGKLGTFQDLPLSVHVYATPKLVQLCAPRTKTADSSVGGVDAQSSAATLMNQFGYGHAAMSKEAMATLAEHINSLLVWLADGEEAIRQSMLSREAEKQSQSIKAQIEQKRSMSTMSTVASNSTSLALKKETPSTGGAVGLSDAKNVGQLGIHPALNHDVDGTNGNEDDCNEAELSTEEVVDPSLNVDDVYDAVAREREADKASGCAGAGAAEGAVTEGDSAAHAEIADQPSLMYKIEMREYQRMALAWMKQRESGATKIEALGSDEQSDACADGSDAANPFVPFKCNDACESCAVLPRDGLIRPQVAKTASGSDSALQGVPAGAGAGEDEDHPLWEQFMGMFIPERLANQAHILDQHCAFIDASAVADPDLEIIGTNGPGSMGGASAVHTQPWRSVCVGIHNHCHRQLHISEYQTRP